MKTLIIIFYTVYAYRLFHKKGIQSFQGETIVAEPGYAERNTEKKKRKSKHGILIASNENLLTWEQEEIMFSYMERYYLAIVLVPKAQGWRIRQHFQNDGVYQNLMGTYCGGESCQVPRDGDFFHLQRTIVLKQDGGQLMLKPGRTNTAKNGGISLGRVEAATTLSPKVFR